MKKGLCLLMNIPAPLEERYRAVKNAGFETVIVDWDPAGGDTPLEKNAELAARYSLEIENAHLCYSNINNIWLDNLAGDDKEAALTREIALAGQCGIPRLVLHTTDGWDYPEPSEVGLARYGRLITAADKAGVVLALENLRSQKHLAAVLDRYPTGIGFCYDSGHRHCRTPEVDLLSLYGDRLTAIHLHDNDSTEDQHRMPFEGTLDWQKEMAGLKQSAYRGSLTLESMGAGEQLEAYCRRASETADKLLQLLENTPV